MSRTPWRAASQCVTGSQDPCARWKEMSYGEVVISERSFYSYRFFLQLYRGHKCKVFSSSFFFTRFFWYLLLFTFCFIVFETIQIVQIVQLILWYKSNTSYAEAQVLTIVNGQA